MRSIVNCIKWKQWKYWTNASNNTCCKQQHQHYRINTTDQCQIKILTQTVKETCKLTVDSLSYSFDLLIVTGYNYYWFFFFIRLKKLIKTLILFFCNTSYFFNFLPNGEYWNYFNAAAFSSKSLCCKTSLSVKNSYLLKFPDNKAEYWAVCLSKFYWALFCLILLLITLTNDAICWSSVSLGIFMTK